MKRKFIAKENLKVFINNLKNDCDEFIAPKREHLGDIIFGDTKSGNSELLDYEGNSIVSPRAFLLPQTEELFCIKSARESSFIPIEDKTRRVFFGVRACDIKALGLMREFFLNAPEDKFYKERLKHSIFIAVACNKRCLKEAFCYEMDSGPYAKKNFDLQLTGTGEGYLVDIGSRKGSSIVAANKRLFKIAAAAHEKIARRQLTEFTDGLKRIDYKKVSRIIRDNKVNESIWEDIGLRCVVCSGCVTLCPTCSCFSIADRLQGNQGMRLRYCDGCPYAGFTRMTGENTPFPLHKDHIRRFFEHKLNVDVKRYRTPSCVGCARCIETCPGNINIRKFIADVIKG